MLCPISIPLTLQLKCPNNIFNITIHIKTSNIHDTSSFYSCPNSNEDKMLFK